uniref:Uncharacterized protein n=1 Tax=Anguilla anguilla TaxID=7936 RepID=A0A0E9V7E1_ANGAN
MLSKKTIFISFAVLAEKPRGTSGQEGNKHARVHFLKTGNLPR